jgi:hypothetical protein
MFPLLLAVLKNGGHYKDLVLIRRPSESVYTGRPSESVSLHQWVVEVRRQCSAVLTAGFKKPRVLKCSP